MEEIWAAFTREMEPALEEDESGYSRQVFRRVPDIPDMVSREAVVRALEERGVTGNYYVFQTNAQWHRVDIVETVTVKDYACTYETCEAPHAE